MIAAGRPPLDLCSAELDAYFAGCYEAADFLLMLYDSARMPFSDRVPRESFVSFMLQAIPNFPVTGTFESYLFILRSIFGANTDVLFDVPAAGKLSMLVNAAASLEFDLVVREFVDGAYVFYNLETQDEEQIEARGIAGIDSQAQLEALLAEIIPAGIWPDITLGFFELFNFVADDGVDSLDNVVDHLDNQIIFFEIGA